MKERIRRYGALMAAATIASQTTLAVAFSLERTTSPQPWMSNTQQNCNHVPRTSWWPPSQGYKIVAENMPVSSTAFFPSPEQFHQDELSLVESPSTILPDDPVAATQLCNIVHQAACDALIYQKRWRYCVGVWDERLLEWLQGAASPGNFWTPKTYLVVAAGSADNHQSDITIDNHSTWRNWQDVKPLKLSVTTPETDAAQATAAAAENVKKLRSLASRILPRLDNSGRKEMDFPVFDTLVITSCQLQCVLHDVARGIARENASSEATNAHQHHYKSNKRKRKKQRKRQKNQDVPWVVPVSNHQLKSTLLLPSFKVLQSAKQLVVVQTSETVEFEEELVGGTLEELFPNATWLPRERFRRVVGEGSDKAAQEHWRCIQH